ncbi:Fe(3+)-hydroxamate ABC transporter permease FhuB [Agrobacterium pusense]|uniref:Fe(3+)-hydroxamate ABC transporter permease FhuB n=1 Tax=Agrobacterium pusense TaxID=648995 RepID=UPI00345EC748
MTTPRLVLIVTLAAISLQTIAIGHHVSIADFLQALWWPDPASFAQIYIHFSIIPRILVALLAGGALAFVGAIFQQLLKNPLAEPSTLGILSGAQLAITLVSLSTVAVTAGQREIAGLAGGLVAVALVAGLAMASNFAPMTILLCGMVISFSAGSASVILALFHHEYLRGVFIWGSGSLIQNDYSNVTALALRMILMIPVLLLFLRPLSIIALDANRARSLGLSPSWLRAAVLFIATVLSAVVVARVGVIAFVGLAATNLVRLVGARTLRQRLFWGSVLGAAVLLFADSLVLAATSVMGDVPTGTATAIIGSLMMLLLIKIVPQSIDQLNSDIPHQRNCLRTGRFLIPGCLAITAAVALFSLTESIAVDGVETSVLFAGRWPRVLVSASAGAMLAVAGAVTQAITRNPIASPEGLGISAGAGLGIIAAFFVGGMASPTLPLAGGIGGAGVALAIILVVAKGKSYAPGPVLMSGIAIGAFATGIVSLIVASGDPRASYILAWSMGPTFRATSSVAIMAALLAVIGLALSPLLRRPLELLPLGDNIARSLGLDPGRSRLVILLFISVLTGAATIVVGPLSFVGIMAPHIARAAGARGQIRTLLTASAIGATLMISADWLGRTVDFPYEIPAGVIAAFIGGPYFLWVIRSRRSQSFKFQKDGNILG